MKIDEIIKKKRDGLRLDAQEIRDFVISYAKGEIPDYIASALLMAVFIRGMDDEETLWLTSAMMESGETLDMSSIEGFKVDKHSTGGVGDKVSIALLPLVAASGLKIPMISGRGLGHTGGTIDKLEAIPGFRTRFSAEEFVKNVDEIGAAVMAQSERFAPADMKLYAVRDVTGTVESVPLIASSIMSKKIAEGIDGLVLDIKVGSGAFMKSDQEAEVLAEAMIDIGEKMGKKVAAVLTDMNQPLGNAVGNAVEMREAIAALKGNGPADLMEVVYLLGEQMLLLADVAETPEVARRILEKCLSSHQALEKFMEIVERQGGDVNCIDDTNLLEVAEEMTSIKSQVSGYVQAIDTYAIGSACVELGGGRKTIGEEVDRSVGLILNKKIGDTVGEGETLLAIFCDNVSKVERVSPLLERAYKIGRRKVHPPNLKHKLIY